MARIKIEILSLEFAKQEKHEQALQYFEKALDCFYPRSKPIYQEPLLKSIRKTDKFKALMSKHFSKI